MKNENLFMIDDLTLNAIDQLVEKELSDQNIPGMAMAIINNGHQVHVRDYGVACIEYSVAVRSDTLFQTGSMGKTHDFYRDPGEKKRWHKYWVTGQFLF